MLHIRILKPKRVKQIRRKQRRKQKAAPGLRQTKKGLSNEHRNGKQNGMLAPEVKIEPALTHAEPAEPKSRGPSENGALALYFREVGQVKLLTPQEEIILAKRIKKGNAAAREHMIKANLRKLLEITRGWVCLCLTLSTKATSA